MPYGTLLGYAFGRLLFAVAAADFAPPPTALFAPVAPDVICFFAALPTCFPPGYLFAPSGVLLLGPTAFVLAGLEFERLTADGLRAVEGSAFAEGW